MHRQPGPDVDAWGHVIPPEQAALVLQLEYDVSNYVRNMPFIWLKVDDESGPDSDRVYLERNSIALLSNYPRGGVEPLDPSSDGWLGYHCTDTTLEQFDEKVRKSGLWCRNHVKNHYEADFLHTLERYVEAM